MQLRQRRIAPRASKDLNVLELSETGKSVSHTTGSIGGDCGSSLLLPVKGRSDFEISMVAAM